VTAYQSNYAEFYDVIYADKPYADEVAFLDRIVKAGARSTALTWLDVACGTGTHALELLRRGYEVTGLDYSATQLQSARTKLQRNTALNQGRVTFVQGDMCTFDLGQARFDVVSCLFDSLGYAVSNERVIAALQRMRHHLAPAGQVVLEFWHAAAMLTSYEPHRVRLIASPRGELVRTSETTLDVSAQTCTVKFTLGATEGDAALALTETHVCRFFLLQEMAALLSAAGLRLSRAYAGFDAEKPIDADTWHIVAVATASTDV
jgi:SAM-dependent methyltransferase